MKKIQPLQTTPKLTKLQKTSSAFSGCGLGGAGLVGVEVLVGLGLSGRQARVYLALLRLGVGRARVVAVLAGVPRQEVYGLLLELQQMGLVKQNLTVPVSYTAVPFSETVKRLLEQKTHELALLSKQAERVIERIDQSSGFTLAEVAKPCFGEVCEGERGKKYQTAIQQTQTTITTLVSWSRFKQLCFHNETQLIDALKKGIQICIITEKPPNHSLPKWVNPTRKKYPHFKLKTQPTPIEAALMIFDNTQLAIAFNPNTRLSKGPDLWTDHPSLLASYRAYFNSIWNQLEECPYNRTNHL